MLLIQEIGIHKILLKWTISNARLLYFQILWKDDFIRYEKARNQKVEKWINFHAIIQYFD